MYQLKSRTQFDELLYSFIDKITTICTLKISGAPFVVRNMSSQQHTFFYGINILWNELGSSLSIYTSHQAYSACQSNLPPVLGLFRSDDLIGCITKFTLLDLFLRHWHSRLPQLCWHISSLIFYHLINSRICFIQFFVSNIVEQWKLFTLLFLDQFIFHISVHLNASVGCTGHTTLRHNLI